MTDHLISFRVELKPECGNIRLRNLYYVEQSRDEVVLTFGEARALRDALERHERIGAAHCGNPPCEDTSCERESCVYARAALLAETTV